MSSFLFMSYSSLDGRDFAIKLAEKLEGGTPRVPVWLGERIHRLRGELDEQIIEAIQSCRWVLCVLSADSVRPDSHCQQEWRRALQYKKPIIPVRLDPHLAMPCGLGSRPCIISDGGTLDQTVARLRRHLAWVDSPEGQLQSLKYRLWDAERELAGTDPERQARIREDIAELEQQVTEQQSILENPETAEQRVRQSIDAGLEGERRPRPAPGARPQSRVVGALPMIVPSWYQDRSVETRQVGEFLKHPSLRWMTVIGRSGIGKTAMVCRLLGSIQEEGQLPDDGGPLDVDGIVYLNAIHSRPRTNLPEIYTSLSSLLPNDVAHQIHSVYKNPQAPTREKMKVLLQAFPPERRVVVWWDDGQELIDAETGRITDPELNDALHALLELPAHGIKVIATTRITPAELALVEPGLQQRLDLTKGLPHPHAENLLRAIDVDRETGLRDAQESLLSAARERTLGHPGALEHVFGILSADRDTSLPEILNEMQPLLPERIADVLVAEAFSRLDRAAQLVMQALAVYRYPVPPAAVDYLLQPHVPGIDSRRVLSRLSYMDLVRRDTGRYYLHQLDRDHALRRIDEGSPMDRYSAVPLLTRFALRHRAAEWFRLCRKPRESWRSLSDLAPLFSEFELRCDGEDYDKAAAALFEFDHDCLAMWGHYGLMIELHERLRRRIGSPELAWGSEMNLAWVHSKMGNHALALSLGEQALRIARGHGDPWYEGIAWEALAGELGDLGHNARSIEYLAQALAYSREAGDRYCEAYCLGSLGNRYSEIGYTSQAIEYYLQALSTDRAREDRDHRNEVLLLSNLGDRYRDLGRWDQALDCYREALALATDAGHRIGEATALAGIGRLHDMMGHWDEAMRELERSIQIADETGTPQLCRGARETLARVQLWRNDLDAARDCIEAARRFDVPIHNHKTSALLGVVAIRARQRTAAKEAFSAAIDQANVLIASTPERFEALDSKGLALCGLALCGGGAGAKHLSAAKAAYGAARAVNADTGVTREALRLLDALAQADHAGILTEVRPVAAGLSPLPFQPQIRIRADRRVRRDLHTLRHRAPLGRVHPGAGRGSSLLHHDHGSSTAHLLTGVRSFVETPRHRSPRF